MAAKIMADFYRYYGEERLARLCDCPVNLIEQTRKRLAALPYPDFLNTAYWKSIASVIQSMHGYRCQGCGKRAWQVHHLTYAHHGLEHLYPEDLLATCGECHISAHGLPNKMQRSVARVLKGLQHG